MATNDSEKKGMSFMDKLVNFLRKSLPIVGVIVVGILSGIFGYKLGVKSSGSTDDAKESDNSTTEVDEQPRPQYQQPRNQQPRQQNGFQPNRGNNGGGSPFAQNGGMRNNGNNDQLL